MTENRQINTRSDEVVEIDLVKLFYALLKKKWLIIVTTIIGAGIAACITLCFIVPKYEASALMYVNSSSISLGGTKLSVSSSEISASKSLVDTYIVILTSRNTLEDVIEQTGVDYTYEQLLKMVSASAVNDTEIFKIVVTSTSPQEAKNLANTIATTLPNKISSIIEGCSVRIVDSAVTPSVKSSPNNVKNVLIGAFIGALISCAYVFLIFMLDDEINSEDDLTNNFEFPLLAAIPDLTDKHLNKGYGYGYGYYGTGREKKGDS